MTTDESRLEKIVAAMRWKIEQERANQAAGLMSDYVMLEYDDADFLLTALAEARRVPEGHVRTPDGVDRKVLGTLPMTKDGCIVGRCVSVWRTPIFPPPSGFYWDTGLELNEIFEDGGKMMALDAHSADVGGLDNYAVPVSECYSTREAAEQSRSQA